MSNVFSNFPGCECLKLILQESGYENESSLKCINENLLNELEKFVGKNRETLITKLTCEHKNVYSNQTMFKFLPGHFALLLNWCKNEVPHYSRSLSTESVINGLINDHPAFSNIHREIIVNALNNHAKTPNLHRFSDVLMDFSIYLFITAGRACYETIAANLPLPKAGTIRKFKLIVRNSYCTNYVYFVSESNP